MSVIARLGVMLSVALCLCGCLDLCGNDILSRTVSPDHRLHAVTFERSCGATTGFSNHVTVLRADGRLPQAAGNVFVADDNGGAANPMFVRTRWESADRLVITHPKNARVYLREVEIGGVIVVYESAPK